MRLRVLLFATYREIVGEKELAWTADAGATLAQFLDAFLAAHPRLVPHRGSMMVAVNLEVAAPSTVLREGDEVALLPPVSGGAG
jgi:molybdopterin converting factor subunit 1